MLGLLPVVFMNPKHIDGPMAPVRLNCEKRVPVRTLFSSREGLLLYLFLRFHNLVDVPTAPSYSTLAYVHELCDVPKAVRPRADDGWPLLPDDSRTLPWNSDVGAWLPEHTPRPHARRPLERLERA